MEQDKGEIVGRGWSEEYDGVGSKGGIRFRATGALDLWGYWISDECLVEIDRWFGSGEYRR